MAKEASVAPKERVNIVYRPATGDAREEIELPLKLLMLGDYAARPDSTPLEDRKVVSVDKDTFNDVMAAHKLQVDVSVPNRLSGQADDNMAVNLRFGTLKDFEPESVVRQTPELNTLLELRAALTALKGPLGNVPAFRKKIEKLTGDQEARARLLAELGADKKEGE
jgi:type VI secretion system protein ImpB